MVIVRVLVNAVIMAGELGTIAAVAWCGWRYPMLFAILTALLGWLLGIWMERARLANEIAFYMDGTRLPRAFFISSVAMVEATSKALVGGVAALLTFSGTDQTRLGWVAVVFGVALFGGTSLLRRLRITLHARPARWGYFRLAAPLGLLFSGGMTALVAFKVLPDTGLGDLTRKLLLDTPVRPTIAQASELLFLFKQYFDAVIVSFLSNIMSRDMATVAGVLLSVNMLTGFVVAIYAVVIAEMVKKLEAG